MFEPYPPHEVGPAGAAWAGAPAEPAAAPSSAPRPRRQAGPPLSSRAVLMVGSLALLCLALVAALAFVATGAPPPPALDGAAPPAPAVAPAAAPADAYPAEAAPVADTTLMALERASTGPIEAHLARLLTALQEGFGAAGVELAPVLRPYVAHAAGRMNVHPAAFRVVVSVPEAALAEARANVLRRAFQSAGLPADKLTVTARAGRPALALTR